MNQSGLILKSHGFTLEGYKLVFQTRQLMGSYGNTLFYVFASTALGMLITVLGAYPLSKSDLLWSNALMLIISFTMMFSGGIITFYMVVRSLGMYNTRLAVILPTCVSAFNLILVRTAMATLPKELEESARLDGAGPIAVLFKIVLPLIKDNACNSNAVLCSCKLEFLVQCIHFPDRPGQISTAADSAGSTDPKRYKFGNIRIFRRTCRTCGFL